MEHLELVTQFCNIARSHRWDLLANLLADDFYFLSAINRVDGAENYVEFERNRTIISTHDTLHLFKSNDGLEYFHIYKATIIDPIYFSIDYHEVIGVKNEQIQYSILTTKLDEFPKPILDRLKKCSEDRLNKS